jgi:hypothetical protein
MPIINLTKENIYGEPLDEERHELLLFRGELLDTSERYQLAKHLIPLIDNRLQKINDERALWGLAESDPVAYAEKVRDYDTEMDAQARARLG